MSQEQQPSKQIAGDRVLKWLGLDPNKWTVGDRCWALLGVGIGLAIVLIAICSYVFFSDWEWTGLTEPKLRTFWDWLKLLIVPIVLALGGYMFTRSEARREQHLADQRAQDEALQAYLDKMSELLIDGGLHKKSNPYGPTRVTARTRTLAILRQLDGVRKRIVLLFLRESRLINSKARCWEGRLAAHPRLVGLKGADLKNADLRGARLISTSGWEAVSLEGADLEGANVEGAHLERADLRKVVLIGANLRGVHLNGTKAQDGADLSGADLRGADLSGANLSNANLRDARGWTDDQLSRASSLEGAIMPNGQKYEDWLKSKGRGEDGGE